METTSACNKVYLDHAATTPLAEEVIQAMVGVMRGSYGNPSSVHSLGQEAKTLIEETRRKVADYLKVSPAEIVFTSCGTESNNMIIKSAVAHLGVERIITSPLEHKCVAEACLDQKRRKGIELVYLRPDAKGELSFEKLEALLAGSEKKTLVSLMHANNEIGNLIDLKRLAELCKKYNALIHSDTVQTMAHMEMDLSEIPVDFASCSAHKFHGPKGAGFAFVRKSSGLKGIILGGGQERSMRSGTENVIGIVGLGKALDLALEHMEEYKAHMLDLKAYLVSRLTAEFPGVKFNGHSADPEKSLYTLVSVLLPFSAPMLAFQLDLLGIAVSQGSACSSGASKPSMVMLSILDDEQLATTTPLRVSFSHITTREDLDRLIDALKEVQPK